VLSLVGLQRCTPEPGEENFQEWWQAAELKVPKQARSGFNSLVSLVVWCFWKQRNACVFDGVSPEVPRTILDIKNEATLWCMAGAKDLSSLGLGRVLSGGE
jgi:hypothetical protein